MNLATKVPNNRNPPSRRLTTRILPTEDLGLQGFPMETAQIQRSFGRLVDQHLLSLIPEGIEKFLDREGDLLTEAQQQWRGEKVKHKMNPEDRVALLGRRGMVIYVQPKFRPLPSRLGRNFRLKYPRDIPGGGVSAH